MRTSNICRTEKNIPRKAHKHYAISHEKDVADGLLSNILHACVRGTVRQIMSRWQFEPPMSFIPCGGLYEVECHGTDLPAILDVSHAMRLERRRHLTATTASPLFEHHGYHVQNLQQPS